MKIPSNWACSYLFDGYVAQIIVDRNNGENPIKLGMFISIHAGLLFADGTLYTVKIPSNWACSYL